ncbi:aldehyde ferredoxin oxidoreductase [Clostridia bacterium]|nr:aldehyde ferredoxin oxidoreductase [Clostridia bacterium]
MKLLRINVADQSYKFEELTGDDQLLGGRGLTNKIITEEIPPGCDAMGRHNKLIFATGLMPDSAVSSGGRISIGCKSPLTGGVKEANSGGIVANSMAKQGIRGIILEEKADKDSLWLLKIENDTVEFIDAKEYSGLGNFSLAKKLFEKYSEDYAIISVGPSGEYGMMGSGIANTDMFSRQSRMSARGGIGAVMGEVKRVKAILIPRKGSYQLPNRNSDAFKKARMAFNTCIATSDRPKAMKKYGTADTVMPVQKLGGLPTRNFSEGTFEHAEDISGEALYDLIQERGGCGRNWEPCMPGCIVQCSNVVPKANGEELVAPLEYETIALMGSNLGLGTLDEIGELNYIANDLGLDTIELGGALGVMAEGGMVEFGDFEGFKAIMNEVYTGGMRGRIAGNGASRAGQLLGVRRIPTVKDQTMSAYDPRGVKGTGITYATTPMGADHTAGLTVFIPKDHHDKNEGWVGISRNMQITRALYDIAGICAFVTSATAMQPELLRDMINTLYNREETIESLNKWAIDLIMSEKAYNEKCGLGKSTDRIPEFMKEEPLPPYDLLWDITDEELDAMWEDQE